MDPLNQPPADQVMVRYPVKPLTQVVELLVCPECGCALLIEQRHAHAAWHVTLRNSLILAPLGFGL